MNGFASGRAPRTGTFLRVLPGDVFRGEMVGQTLVLPIGRDTQACPDSQSPGARHEENAATRGYGVPPCNGSQIGWRS